MVNGCIWGDRTVLLTAPTPNTPKLSPDQDVATVLKCRQGRFFITTAIGEVAIASDNLRFWRSGQEANRALLNRNMIH